MPKWRRWWSCTVAEFGRLDAAFNNAGVMAHIAPTADSTREDWDRVIGINLRGVWSCMKHELRQMERSGQRRDRQQRIGRRVDWQPRYRLLHRIEARRRWPDADGRSGIHQAWHPRERSKSRPDRYANRPRCRQWGRAGVRRDCEARSYRPRGQARGDRVRGAMALQSGGELRGGSCPHRGWRNDSHVISAMMRNE